MVLIQNLSTKMTSSLWLSWNWKGKTFNVCNAQIWLYFVHLFFHFFLLYEFVVFVSFLFDQNKSETKIKYKSMENCSAHTHNSHKKLICVLISPAIHNFGKQKRNVNIACISYFWLDNSPLLWKKKLECDGSDRDIVHTPYLVNNSRCASECITNMHTNI